MAVAFLAGGARAQNSLDRTIYPERLWDDLELMRTAIHEAHPDPYRYHTKAELDAVCNAIRDSITRPMTVVGFQRVIVPLFKALGDANCLAHWPPDVEATLANNALLLPLKVRLLPQGVFVEEELKGFRSIPVGSRLVSINERPIGKVVTELMASVVCDGANQTMAERMLERNFNRLYHLYIERTSSFMVSYITPSNQPEQQVIFGMTAMEIAGSSKPGGAKLSPWGSTWYNEGGVLWVDMNTLEPDSLDAAGQRPDRFLQALLSEANRNGAKTLVLDLRGAGGSDLAMAGLVFSAIARAPFQVLGDMIVRSVVPPAPRASHTFPDDFYASSNTRFLAGGEGAFRLPGTDSRMAQRDPMDRAFGGGIYLVCDGNTRDAAAALVMLVRRTRRGRVVGEETGSNAFGFTGGPEWVVSAPASGLRLHIPLLKVVPAGRGEGPTDRGEQPNHPAFQSPWAIAKGVDGIRTSLLELIRELE